MTDFALDTATNDLALEGGDLSLVEGGEDIRQQVELRFSFGVGEWLLDLRQGFSFHLFLGVKPPPLDLIRELIFQALSTTPGVTKVNAIELAYDNASRALSISFASLATTEGTVEITSYILGGIG